MKRLLAIVLFILVSAAPLQAFMSDSDIAVLQSEIQVLPAGQKIALWAERFLGTPYDPEELTYF